MTGRRPGAPPDGPSGGPTRTGSLLFVRRATAIQEASEELRYLHELNLVQASRIFDRVESRLPDRFLEALSGFGLVLLQGPEALLLGRASLGVMRSTLSEPDPAVRATSTYPVRLDRILGDRTAPVFTLRQYEELEAGWLAGERPVEPETERRHPDVPALLVRSDDLLSRCDAKSLTAWARGEAGLEDLAGRLDARPAGLCHCFIDYYGTVREDVLALLPDAAVDVLEVGCGRGLTGELLRRERGCRVTGVELNPAAAAEARGRLHRVIQGDVAAVDLEGPFDAAVLFDVVEHVPRPEELLRRVAGAVRPGGSLLLSVPNVGHHSVVGDLLAGRWDYLPIGLLCYTHLRFFTRRTLEDWLGRCGFDSFRIVERRTELPDEMRDLPDGLDVDLDSLETHGFHVVVDVRADASSR